jgi:hypothetical protein
MGSADVVGMTVAAMATKRKENSMISMKQIILFEGKKGCDT